MLTEIVKADPTFDKDSFLKQCEKDIIPNILEVNSLLPRLLLCLAHSVTICLVYTLHSTSLGGLVAGYDPRRAGGTERLVLRGGKCKRTA